MKPEIENLKVWMSGRSTTGYQRALGMREFEKLLDYIAELEQLRQPLVMPSLPDGLIEGSNCDDNYKQGWLDCWHKVKGNEA